MLLSDVWGVIHNGIAAYAPACEALTRFRARGGTVDPHHQRAAARHCRAAHSRPARACRTMLMMRSRAPATSPAALSNSRLGENVFHLGPERDHSIFAGLDVEFTPLESADYVVCSGLFDDTIETPDSYRDMLAAMRARSLFMVCANPDIVVERGDTLVYCAGALADAYAALGGEVLYCGKPHAPIYRGGDGDSAAARGGAAVPLERVLAIGDSVRTDLKGAAAFGIDSLFVTSGIHAEEYGGRDTPDIEALNAIFAAGGVMPKAVMRGLRW